MWANHIISVRQYYKTGIESQIWGAKFVSKYKDLDIVPLFLSHLKTTSRVLENWKNLIGEKNYSGNLSEVLLKETIPVWITMRVKQVVNVYMFNRKQSGSSVASRKGAPAMRKTLDKFY